MISGDEIDLSELETQFHLTQANPYGKPVPSPVESTASEMPCQDRNPWISTTFTAVQPGIKSGPILHIFQERHALFETQTSSNTSLV